MTSYVTQSNATAIALDWYGHVVIYSNLNYIYKDEIWTVYFFYDIDAG